MIHDTPHSIEREGPEAEYDVPKAKGQKVQAHDEVFGAIKEGGPNYRNVSLSILVRSESSVDDRSAGWVLPSSSSSRR
jgi:hypothetical protein